MKKLSYLFVITIAITIFAVILGCGGQATLEVIDGGGVVFPGETVVAGDIRINIGVDEQGGPLRGYLDEATVMLDTWEGSEPGMIQERHILMPHGEKAHPVPGTSTPEVSYFYFGGYEFISGQVISLRNTMHFAITEGWYRYVITSLTGRYEDGGKFKIAMPVFTPWMHLDRPLYIEEPETSTYPTFATVEFWTSGPMVTTRITALAPTPAGGFEGIVEDRGDWHWITFVGLEADTFYRYNLEFMKDGEIYAAYSGELWTESSLYMERGIGMIPPPMGPGLSDVFKGDVYTDGEHMLTNVEVKWSGTMPESYIGQVQVKLGFEPGIVSSAYFADKQATMIAATPVDGDHIKPEDLRVLIDFLDFDTNKTFTPMVRITTVSMETGFMYISDWVVGQTFGLKD